MDRIKKIINEYRALKYLEATLLRWDVWGDNVFEDCIEYATIMKREEGKDSPLSYIMLVLCDTLDKKLEELNFEPNSTAVVALCKERTLLVGYTASGEGGFSMLSRRPKKEE